MLRYLDTGDEVDLLNKLHAERREPGRRPWVMLNMVTSVDGATALEGGASALNDEDDRRLFLALRSVADVVLVGAATVRSERLGPVRLTDEMRSHRHGQPDPRLAIATRSLDLDPGHRVFSDPERRPILVASKSSDPARLAEFEPVADIVITPSDDGEGLVAALSPAEVILCEGGPTLNSQLIAAGMVDEIDLTISPLFALGQSKRVASGPELHPAQEMRLDRVLKGERSLFLRFVRPVG